jgi:hypothetical protein
MIKKRWYEEWEVTHNMKGKGIWTVNLPNSSADMKELVVNIRANKTQTEWLISFLENALMTLSDKDRKIEKERNTKKD